MQLWFICRLLFHKFFPRDSDTKTSDFRPECIVSCVMLSSRAFLFSPGTCLLLPATLFLPLFMQLDLILESCNNGLL